MSQILRTPKHPTDHASCLVQKSGINAKNDNVKVLGIRVREVMHERRIELLESAAVQPGVSRLIPGPRSIPYLV